MPRTKTFSVDEAIEKATALFLERGYAALSMRTIGEALGLSRSTVYSTFGDKLRLFVTVLERYGPARLPGRGLHHLIASGEDQDSGNATAKEQHAGKPA